MRSIDLRSDTVTKPSAAMRDFMRDAEVGDDVYGEDPSVSALERECAALLGQEAGLFTSSGTQANQLAIACHTRPGDEVVVGEGAHVAFYEVGAAAALSGVQFSVAGHGGHFDASELDAACKPVAYYTPRTSLVCVENTHNRAGGRTLSVEASARLVAHAKQRGFATHLDGARLWNAAIARGCTVTELAAGYDSVSVCFSKGLGAPVGSMLTGTRALIESARRLRKMWGGGMRQVGMLAAAARFSLEHNVSRLADDHRRAARLAQRLAASSAFEVSEPETNLVLVTLRSGDAAEAARRAKEAGVLVGEWSPTMLRLCTHLDVDDDDIERSASVLLGMFAS